MVRVLFWNINKKPLAKQLRLLCQIHDVDILVLAECTMTDEELLPTLNKEAQRTFVNPVNPSGRLSFFIRPFDTSFQLVHDGPYCSIRAITAPSGNDILLAAIHFSSKMHMTSEDQSSLLPRIVSKIREAEDLQGHMRTVVVGDLNMNPFETGICSAEGFHAVMCKDIAKKEKRTVSGQDRPFFYNPMWNFLGDETPGPPGTYWWNKGVTAFFWNIFDQVLYRPALLEGYREHDVSIITAIENEHLVRNGRIAPGFSDHLPVFFNVRT